MSVWEMLAVAAAGLAAGSINAVVGSGTLVTFPVLLAVGLPPVTATVSNSLGLVAGNVTGAVGYRRELSGQRRLLLRLLPGSVLGALTGVLARATVCVSNDSGGMHLARRSDGRSWRSSGRPTNRRRVPRAIMTSSLNLCSAGPA